MDEVGDAAQYLAKAEESLAGAGSEFSNGRYNNCANRSYYACFQAAIAALIRAGIRPQKRTDRWPHAFVISRFSGVLIRERRQFPLEMRSELDDLQSVRHTADYKPEVISENEASRVLRRAHTFVATVRERGRSTE